MKRIFSGMQPTNNLMLGNYLGALKNWVDLQDEDDTECIYCVVDLHAITVNYDPKRLASLSREVAATYIAAGVDPNKSTLFVQSAVPEHSELMWLLGTMSQMGKLERMTQFKDKAGKHKERAGLGLFSYPVLMAADILLYRATHVPVGEDQKQHLELSREIASTFNTRYGQDFFPQPEPYIMGQATRVMSLKDGSKKMSKSDESDLSRINLTDDADTIVKKIKKAKTDAGVIPTPREGLEGRPEVANLVNIYSSLSGMSVDAVLAEYAGAGFGIFKPALAELCVESLAPMTSKLNELLSEPGEIDSFLQQGALKAREVASKTMDDVRDIMGFWTA